KAEIDDFTADNETGTPQLITSGGQVPTTSVRPFLGTIADIPLKPGETKKITITLKVPAEQPAGGYYGVLRFKAFPANTANDTNGQRVSLTASVGHIILVQVPGQITEKLDALSLRAEYHKNPSNFFIHPPDGMRLEVKNIGNSFIKPFGTVSVKDGKGKEIYSYEINATDPRGNVLPKSTRAFHDNIKNIGKFGHYSAVASVTYGNGGDVLGLKTSFWVVPLWVMIVAGAVVLVAAISIALLVRLWRKHRRNLHTRH
ncbi:MAG TPA: hypothetical protein VLE74_00670, partial [Candidatus Saccharimonadales bacterium]|nr:hypothetical protein [Candidatus Saccharimonadales bacterium]